MPKQELKFKSPEILMIDFNSNISNNLIKKGFSVETASFGEIYELGSKEGDLFCDTGKEIKNLIEKDIVIINMKQKKSDYLMSAKDIYTFEDGTYIVSKKYQKFLNQININSSNHKLLFSKMRRKETIFIVFADDYITEEYRRVFIKNRRFDFETEKISNFDFFPHKIEVSERVKSEKYNIVDNEYSKSILKNFNGKINSNCTFWLSKYFPTFPILTNIYDNVIGYVQLFPLDKAPSFSTAGENQEKDNRKITYIVLPQVDDFNKILDNILTDFLPDQYPEMFADLVKDSWMEKECYMLPEIRKVVEAKKALDAKYQKDLEEINKKLEDEKSKNQFLYNIISSTGTGDMLVDNIIKCLEYLGYPKVEDWDEKNDSDENEEDLHIYINDTDYFIGEVKGINGPPIEDDCNVIVKYKSRNCYKLGKSYIHGIDFFNYRKNVEPNLRDELGFTPKQIKDSKRDLYTLVGTYELFKAIRLCQENILTKESVRKSLETPGLFKAIPDSFEKLGKIDNLLKNQKVICIPLECDEIKIGDELLVAEENNYYKCKIVSMQVDDKDVEVARKGDGVGIKIDGEFPKVISDEIYLMK